MKALVTGGGGFLGQHIVRRLLDRGDEVRVLGRSRYPQLEDWKVPCVRGDVTDPAAVRTAVDGVDTIFHVAARVGYWGRHQEYVDTNVGGTRNLIEVAQDSGVTRFVYTSTPSVVIGADGVEAGRDESLPYPERYLSSYGPTKAQAERAVLDAHGDALRTGAIRPHFVFGPRDPQIVPRLVRRAHEGRLAQVGDGSNLVDVSYIDNVVDAHVMLADALGTQDSPAGGKAYFLGQSEPVRLWDFIRSILEALDAPPIRRTLSFSAAYRIGWLLEGFFRMLPPSREPPLTRMAAVMLGTSHYFDHQAAHRDFGFVPRVSTKEGLERTFRWFRSDEGQALLSDG
ncbi:MAG: NAD-dependent epimerase/dehydratase family protein [Myxococcota bacterium]